MLRVDLWLQYAMLAVSSVRTYDVRDGVAVLQTLLEEEGPKRDYLYFIAQGACLLEVAALAQRMHSCGISLPTTQLACNAPFARDGRTSCLQSRQGTTH